MGMRWYPELWMLHPEIAQAVIYLEAKEAERRSVRDVSVVEAHVAGTIEAARDAMR